jgi:uncharacterized OsmC-like protein
MLEYHVSAHRLDAHGSLVAAKEASLVADTDLAGRKDAFNPAELLLAALAACILKGAERVLPMLEFKLRGLSVELHAVRQDSPPKLISIDYVITVDTDETDHRLELLHKNIRKYGTISNTLASAVPIEGQIVRG